MFGGPRASAVQELNIPATQTFHKEYNSPACTVEIVDDVHAAIDHINQHGRYHIFLIPCLHVNGSLLSHYGGSI